MGGHVNPSRPTRRRFLGLAAALGGASAAGALAACQTAPAAPAAKPAATAAAPAKPAAQAAAPAAAAKPASLERATLRLDFLPWGAQAPFFLGLERGHYAAEGIALELGDGRGSPVTVRTVGSGTDPFGFVAVSAMALGVGEEIPVRSIAMLTNRNAYGVMIDADADWRTLADMYGKRVIVITAGPEFAMTQAVLRRNGLDERRVQFVNVEPASKYTLYTERQADAVIGPIPIMPLVQEKRPSKALAYADFGLTLQDYGLITNLETLNGSPDKVGRFVRASIKAWEDARNDPRAAAEALVKNRPDANLEIMHQQMVLQLNYLHSPRTEGKPIGWSADEDWRDGLAVLKEFGGLKGETTNLGQFFTNQFIPGA